MKLAVTLFNAVVWPMVVDEIFSAFGADNFPGTVEALGL